MGNLLATLAAIFQYGHYNITAGEEEDAAAAVNHIRLLSMVDVVVLAREWSIRCISSRGVRTSSKKEDDLLIGAAKSGILHCHENLLSVSTVMFAKRNLCTTGTGRNIIDSSPINLI